MDSVCDHAKIMQTSVILGGLSALVFAAQLFGVSFISAFHTTTMNATTKLVKLENTFSALAADTQNSMAHGMGPSV